jgi:Protein of unknown function (DUF2637)
MTGDRYRPLTAAAVLLVAAIAAVVSYMHVATLALHYGQPPLAAYLLPLSIDGMVAHVQPRAAALGQGRGIRAMAGQDGARAGRGRHPGRERGQRPATRMARCAAGRVASDRVRGQRRNGHQHVAAPGGRGTARGPHGGC